MDKSIEILNILNSPIPIEWLRSLLYLESIGYTKEFLDSHPNINSVEIPPGSGMICYFLMTEKIEDHVRNLGLIPFKYPERYEMIPHSHHNRPFRKRQSVKRAKIKHSLTKTNRGESVWCHYCARPMDGSKKELTFTIDHWLPKNKGGKNTKSNYRMCCYGCNQARNTVDRAGDIEMKFYKYVKYLEHIREQGVERIHLDFLVHIL